MVTVSTPSYLRFYLFFFAALLCFTGFAQGISKTYHVSVNGNDKNNGTGAKPFKTIMAAAKAAMPGDIVTVHAGVYRESINPPRGGTADNRRITYQAAKGEKVIIKGSEVRKNWVRVDGQVWKTIIPNSFFGNFNPYNDYIRGDWYVNIKKRKLHTGAVYLNGHWLSEAADMNEVMQPAERKEIWFATVDDKETTIYARFADKNPNDELVEINVRQTIFYPEKTGINYLTVRGFVMTQAATNWAPPTAEQKAVIGTNWSKGWIIENNDVSYSICSGISLGKYGDEFDNTSANGAEGYVETVKRALQNSWNKETVGHHKVRNNHISHCEQAGIVGSLGCSFSTISDNVVHDIHVMGWFFGYEMAGIKFHGAVDAVINHNHIFRCNRGIWLDWMTQGTMVTNNLLHDNDREKGYDQADIYLEVNHGPAIVANNFFLSERAILNRSNGTAFLHNLITGSVLFVPETKRETPYLQPHSTELKGMAKVQLGDDRWINNMIAGKTSLDGYGTDPLPLQFSGNLLLDSAAANSRDRLAIDASIFNPEIKLIEESGSYYLIMHVDKSWMTRRKIAIVKPQMLGKTVLAEQQFETIQGAPDVFSTDYFGKKRIVSNPSPGPFEITTSGKQKLKLW